MAACRYCMEQEVYATFFVEDAIRYFAAKEGIAWVPNRPIQFEVLYVNREDLWKFGRHFAEGISYAKLQFKELCNSECSSILTAINSVPVADKQLTLHAYVSHLAQRIIPEKESNFPIFIAILVDLCVKLFKGEQPALIFTVINAAKFYVIQLAPGQIYGMFLKLYCLFSIYTNSNANSENLSLQQIK